MNVAQMLAERMKSPGAMGAFKDMTSNPDAMKYVQAGTATQMPGSGKQEPYPLETDGVDGDDTTQSGMPSDGGLGMLESAHASAKGKHKEVLGKALAHGKAKHGKAMPHHGKK